MNGEQNAKNVWYGFQWKWAAFIRVNTNNFDVNQYNSKQAKKSHKHNNNDKWHKENRTRREDERKNVADVGKEECDWIDETRIKSKVAMKRSKWKWTTSIAKEYRKRWLSNLINMCVIFVIFVMRFNS